MPRMRQHQVPSKTELWCEPKPAKHQALLRNCMHSLGLRAPELHFAGLLPYHTKPHWTRCGASASRPKAQHPKALDPGLDTPLALQEMAQQTKPNSNTPKQAFYILESFFRTFLPHCSHLNSFIPYHK